MKILLLDVKEFATVQGTIFERGSYSFNMKAKVEKLWSNGWCPVTQFKVDDCGKVYGRIANELVPEDYYNNVVIETCNRTLRNRCSKVLDSFENMIKELITEQQWIRSGYIA